MSELSYIKKDYAVPEYQDEIREDAVILFVKNMTASFNNFNGRYFSVDEVNHLVVLFRERLMIENKLLNFNQTS